MNLAIIQRHKMQKLITITDDPVMEVLIEKSHYNAKYRN